MTPSGIESATFGLVVQCLSQRFRGQIINPASLSLGENTELAINLHTWSWK